MKKSIESTPCAGISCAWSNVTKTSLLCLGALAFSFATASEYTLVDMDDFGTKYLNYINGVYDEDDERWDDGIYYDTELFDQALFAKFWEQLSEYEREEMDISTKEGFEKAVAKYDAWLEDYQDNSDYYSGSFSDARYKKAQTVTGVLYDEDENLAGTVEIKASKASKKGVLTISATVKDFASGKKLSAKTKLNSSGGEGIMAFKAPIGRMTFVLDASGDFSMYGDSYFVRGGGTVGGKLDVDSLSFAIESDDEPYFGEEWCILDEVSPDGTEITVKKGTKWSCDKAASIKYKKVDGDYELVGLDDEKRPNLSGLKLSYSYKSGEFKGSFNVYVSNECDDVAKPKLKKYSVSVSGIVIDGVGYGTATLKKPNKFTWTVRID